MINLTNGEYSANIVLDAINPFGTRITTFELEIPRFLLAEFNTHRMFSRNSASSRAIPVTKTLSRFVLNPVLPEFYGKERPGMQAKEELPKWKQKLAATAIRTMAAITAGSVLVLNKVIGLHKQNAGRYFEPFQMTKVLVTATEYENFFQLRDHPAAQPEFRKVAKLMKECLETSVPQDITFDQWYLPYVGIKDSMDPEIENHIKVSVSCCAQVSYRNLDESLEKSLRLYEMLTKNFHMSPFEHQAKVSELPTELKDVPFSGFTHIAIDNNLCVSHWSGNFKNYVQLRKIMASTLGCNLITGEVARRK